MASAALKEGPTPSGLDATIGRFDVDPPALVDAMVAEEVEAEWLGAALTARLDQAIDLAPDSGEATGTLYLMRFLDRGERSDLREALRRFDEDQHPVLSAFTRALIVQEDGGSDEEVLAELDSQPIDREVWSQRIRNEAAHGFAWSSPDLMLLLALVWRGDGDFDFSGEVELDETHYDRETLAFFAAKRANELISGGTRLSLEALDEISSPARFVPTGADSERLDRLYALLRYEGSEYQRVRGAFAQSRLEMGLSPTDPAFWDGYEPAPEPDHENIAEIADSAVSPLPLVVTGAILLGVVAMVAGLIYFVRK